MSQVYQSTNSHNLELIDSGSLSQEITGTLSARQFHELASTDITGLNLDNVLVYMYARDQTGAGDLRMRVAPSEFLIATSAGNFTITVGFLITSSEVRFGYFGLGGSAETDKTLVAPFTTFYIQYFVFKIA